MPTYTITLPNGKEHTVSSDKPLGESDLTELTDSLMTPSVGMGNLRQREEQPVQGPEMPSTGDAPRTVTSAPVESKPGFWDRVGEAYARSGAGIGGTPIAIPQSMEEANAITGVNKQVLPLVAGIAAPELAVAALPGLGTTAAGSGLGVAGRLLTQGGISSAAESATRQGLNEGTVDPAKIGIDTAVGAVGNTLVGGALWRANAALQHVAEQWARNRSITGVPGDLLSGVFFKRGAESAEQAASRVASQQLAANTGVQQPIVLPSDNIPEMAQDIHNARVAAIQSATGLGVNTSRANLMRGAYNAIADRGIQFTRALRQSIEYAVNQLHHSFVNIGANRNTQAEQMLNRLRAGSTPEEASTAIGARVNSGIAEQKAAVDTAYDTLRQHPNYATAEGNLSNTQRIIADINNTALRRPATTQNPILGPNGQPIPSNQTEPNLGTLGPEVRKFIGEIGDSVTIPQTLDRVENWKSRLGEAIGNDNDIFNTSLGKGNVKRLYASVANDAADIAQSANPQLAQLQSQAHSLQRNFIERNEHSLIQKVFNNDSELGPRQLFDQLTGKDAAVKLEPLLQTAGPQRAPEILNRLREGILSDAYASSTRADGNVDFENVISRMMSARNNLGQRFDQMFPNLQNGYNALRQAAQSGAFAERFRQPTIETINAFNNNHDAQAFLLAHDPVSAQNIRQYVNHVLENHRVLQEFNNTGYTRQILRELDSTGHINVPDVVDHFFEQHNNLGNVRQVIDTLENHDPVVAGELRSHFLGSLLDRMSVPVRNSQQRMFIPELLLRDLANTSQTGAPGRYNQIATEVLGGPTVQAIHNTAQQLQQSSENTLFHALQNENDLAGTLNTLYGHGSNFSRWRGLLSTITESRYYLAGRLLQNQDTRRMLLTPVSDLSKQQVERLSNVINATLQDQVQQ